MVAGDGWGGDGWEDAPSADVEKVGFVPDGVSGADAGWEAALAVAVGEGGVPWGSGDESGVGFVDDGFDDGAGFDDGGGGFGVEPAQVEGGSGVPDVPGAGEPDDGAGLLLPAGGLPVPDVPTFAAGEPGQFAVGDGLEGLSGDAAALAAGVPLPAVPGSGGDVEKRRKKKRRSKTIGGLRLTVQDHQIIGFLGRYKVATVGQLSRRFDRSMPALRNRMPRLERAGLVDSYYGAENRTKIWVATEAGMRTVQMFLPGTTQIAWGWLRHQLHLTDIGIVMERAGEIVLTEREIRAASTRKHTPRDVDGYFEMAAPTPRMQTAYEQADDGEGWSVSELTRARYTVPKVGRKSNYGHIPDMVLLRQPFPDGRPGNIAIELELSRKNTAQWREVLEAYVRYDGYAQVHYFFTDRGLMRSVWSVAKSIHGGQDKVRVSMFKPVDQSWNPKAAKRR